VDKFPIMQGNEFPFSFGQIVKEALPHC